MENGDLTVVFGPIWSSEDGSKSYVVVEVSAEMLRVYQYRLGLGADGGPVSLNYPPLKWRGSRRLLEQPAG